MKNLVSCILFVYVVSKAAAVQLSLPYTCTTTICQSGRQDSASSGINHAPNQQGPQGKRGAVGSKGDKGDPCHCDVADEQAMQDLRDEWNSKINEYNDIIKRLKLLEDFPENCSVRQAMSLNAVQENQGHFDAVPIYPLKFIGDLTPWMVNCTKILSEGTDGWITIQRRQDGKTVFYRNWDNYEKGFGNRHEEFWLGLKNIHELTTKRGCKLRIDMTGWDGTKHYAEYTTFQVGNEDSYFQLTISGYTGNAWDAMAYHNGRSFSTSDRDNDAHSSLHCAQHYTGPWWHGGCHHSNLNGAYCKSGAVDTKAVWWNNIKSCLRFVEMKIFCS